MPPARGEFDSGWSSSRRDGGKISVSGTIRMAAKGIDAATAARMAVKPRKPKWRNSAALNANASGTAILSIATDVCRSRPHAGQGNPPDSHVGIPVGEIKLPQAGHFRSYRAITWPVLNELLRKQFDRYFNCKPCGSKHIGCGGRSA